MDADTVAYTLLAFRPDSVMDAVGAALALLAFKPISVVVADVAALPLLAFGHLPILDPNGAAIAVTVPAFHASIHVRYSSSFDFNVFATRSRVGLPRF
jgi:hypothetical protein